MSVLAIDNFIKKPTKNRVRRVGVEMEGLWTKLPAGVSVLSIHRDTSVKDFPDDVLAKARAIGEAVSPIIMPLMIEPWVTKMFPTHVNSTCGLHIHQSFESPLNYMRLMKKDYQDTMLEYLKRWAEEEKLPNDHCFWDRIAGKNEYCSLDFWPNKQVNAVRKDYDRGPGNVRLYKNGHRYTALNYCHGLNNMQTLEIRVLPMFDTPQQCVRALHRVIDVTNACLIRLSQRERPVSAEFTLDGKNANVDRAESIYR